MANSRTMRVFSFVIGLCLLLVGCATSPIVSSDVSSSVDQEWLIKLSTQRVRDETILKSQDKVPLNYDDLSELLTKEVSHSDIISLVHDIGVSPKLKKDELAQLQQQGASPNLLQELGQTTPPSMSRTIQVREPQPEPLVTPPKPAPVKAEPTHSALTTSKPKKKEPEPTVEKKKIKRPVQTQGDTTYKAFEPRSIDPVSRR